MSGGGGAERHGRKGRRKEGRIKGLRSPVAWKEERGERERERGERERETDIAMFVFVCVVVGNILVCVFVIDVVCGCIVCVFVREWGRERERGR